MDELQEHMPIELENVPARPRIWTLLVFVAVGIVVGLAIYLSSAPSNFPSKSFLRVKEGETLVEVTQRAEFLHLVRSSLLLKMAVKVFGDDKKLKAGDYYFDHPVSFWTVADYLATGNYNIKPARIVLYEGINRRQMAVRLAKDLPYFNAEEFLEETKDDEGFLFPDTYFISPAADTYEVIQLLRNSYEAQIAPLREDIKKSGMTENEVVTLASLVERESGGPVDRTTIAGILLNRLDVGMRLQVDAPVMYYMNKGNVDAEDLKVDSPYNTYLHAGLPPTAIGSPGIASIRAVLYPTPSKYLFYIHDRYGNVHYAKTYAEHKRNISQFLLH